jgi:hypothetical protein
MDGNPTRFPGVSARLSATVVFVLLAAGCAKALKVDLPTNYVPPLRDRPPLIANAVAFENPAAALKFKPMRMKGLQVYSGIRIDPSLPEVIERDLRAYAALRVQTDPTTRRRLVFRISKAGFFQTDSTPAYLPQVVKILAARTYYVTESQVELSLYDGDALVETCRLDQPVDETRATPVTKGQWLETVNQLLRRYRPLLMAALVEKCEPQFAAHH